MCEIVSGRALSARIDTLLAATSVNLPPRQQCSTLQILRPSAAKDEDILRKRNGRQWDLTLLPAKCSPREHWNEDGSAQDGQCLHQQSPNLCVVHEQRSDRAAQSGMRTGDSWKENDKSDAKGCEDGKFKTELAQSYQSNAP
jgi:hypothetical protein